VSISPVKSYTDSNGYKYVETADWFKKAVSGLPCFAALHWPNYSTEVIDDTINGKPRVIQLWKGWCPQLADELPGGIGGEVGIYERIPGRTLPNSKPAGVPTAIWDVLVMTIKTKLVTDLWWPVSDQNEVQFNFINPVTNKVVFPAGPEKTYWMNKWMNTDSYEQYKKAQGKKRWWLPAGFPGNSNTPAFAAHYIMDYKINGKSYPRW
jgi:hypothetical protein